MIRCAAWRLASSFVLASVVGCSGNSSGNDAGTSTSTSDAGGSDAVVSDAGASDSTGASDTGDAGGDPIAAKREACGFAAGAMAADSIGGAGVADARAKIGHVILMMKENRSFDHLLGSLPAAGKTDVEGLSATYSNLDATGAKVTNFHQTDTCTPYDPEHQWQSMHDDWNNGLMDGFVKNASAKSTDLAGKPVTTDGHYVMGYYTQTELPFYYWLAQTYSLADHFHAAGLAGTWANRLFLLCGTSYGTKDTGTATPAVATAKTIFDALDAKGVTWGVYTDAASPFEYSLVTAGWGSGHKGVHAMSDFYAALTAGTLPSVAFIDATSSTEDPTGAEDEHPPADLQKGEAWSKKVYDAVTASSSWLDTGGKATALIWTYDENGSFADHVAPPKACPPSADQAAWNNLGPRVPFVLVSPYAKKGYVSHQTHSHTSITRFIESVFDLPAMTARDANSDALLDMFDFSMPALKTPGTAPAAGTGACAKH